MLILVIINEHLFEFIWRKCNEKSLWDSFIDALPKVHYE